MLKNRISRLLLEMGLPASLNGYRYLLDAVSMATEEPLALRKVSGYLYPQIAKNHNATPSSVERSIRHAIEVIFYRGSRKAVIHVFKDLYADNTGKPTNTHFIAHIAEYLKNEEAAEGALT